MKIKLVIFEEAQYCTFYSFITDNNTDCEANAFFADMIKSGKLEDARRISYLLKKISENPYGAEERYFRPAGKIKDNVWELPDYYIVKSKFRLYCIRIDNIIVVLGNGGLKMTRTYQEDDHLNNCVEILQKIDRAMQSLLKAGSLSIAGKVLNGQLEFMI